MSAANAYEKMRKRRERVQTLSQTRASSVNGKMKRRTASFQNSSPENTIQSKADSLDNSTFEEVSDDLCTIMDTLGIYFNVNKLYYMYM